MRIVEWFIRLLVYSWELLNIHARLLKLFMRWLHTTELCNCFGSGSTSSVSSNASLDFRRDGRHCIARWLNKKHKQLLFNIHEIVDIFMRLNMHLLNIHEMVEYSWDSWIFMKLLNINETVEYSWDCCIFMRLLNIHETSWILIWEQIWKQYLQIKVYKIIFKIIFKKKNSS